MHQRGDLTRDSQLIHLSQWLGEFSEVEKDDFLQQLLDLYDPGQLAIGQRLAPLKAEDKAPTLFDCRIDLFKKWFASWEASDRKECLERLREADVEFMERFQKSKETPNEDKIIEKFRLRHDNGSAETNGNAAIQEQLTVGVRENGAVEVQENGNATIQENNSDAAQQHDAPPIARSRANTIQVNGAVGLQENGSIDTSEVARERRHQNGIVPTVEVSSPASETEVEEKFETLMENVVTNPSREAVDAGSHEDENQPVSDKKQGAIEGISEH